MGPDPKSYAAIAALAPPAKALLPAPQKKLETPRIPIFTLFRTAHPAAIKKPSAADDWLSAPSTRKKKTNEAPKSVTPLDEPTIFSRLNDNDPGDLEPDQDRPISFLNALANILTQAEPVEASTQEPPTVNLINTAPDPIPPDTTHVNIVKVSITNAELVKYQSEIIRAFKEVETLFKKSDSTEPQKNPAEFISLKALYSDLINTLHIIQGNINESKMLAKKNIKELEKILIVLFQGKPPSSAKQII